MRQWKTAILLVAAGLAISSLVSADAWHSVGCRADRLGDADLAATDADAQEVWEFWAGIEAKEREDAAGLVVVPYDDVKPGLVAPIGVERVEAPGCP
ncbi:hypothetical protein [Nonomuraea typhae]|uniref:Uncharacterized protein n=1 Tax=Nonomuraea typhae TaxID=2603600 RepID=A0ABW7YPT8_9ACTN